MHIPVLWDLDKRIKMMKRWPGYQQVLTLSMPAIEFLGTPEEVAETPGSHTGEFLRRSEVGTFSHRLPADMVVDNPAHRAVSEKLWTLPAKTLNPKVGSHITEMMRDLEDGKVKWLWVQVTNPFQSTANANHWIHAAREKDSFIVVSDVYPTLSCKVADLILPSAMIFEKWGGYGNSERRTQLWREQVPRRAMRAATCGR